MTSLGKKEPLDGSRSEVGSMKKEFASLSFNYGDVVQCTRNIILFSRETGHHSFAKHGTTFIVNGYSGDNVVLIAEDGHVYLAPSESVGSATTDISRWKRVKGSREQVVYE